MRLHIPLILLSLLAPGLAGAELFSQPRPTPLPFQAATGLWLSPSGSSTSAGSDGTVPGPDYAGLRRDAGYLLGYQAATVGLLYLMPERISRWSEEEKSDFRLTQWRDNASEPVWDQDLWYINYILHPYWGAAYFVRGRERGLGNTGAFWYSAALSAMFEFGVEAMFEKPSYQDLISTPVAGSLLGLYFMRLRGDIEAKESWDLGDRVLLVLTDPLGALNRQTDRLLGRQAGLEVGFLPDRSVTAGPAGLRREQGKLQQSDHFWGARFSLAW